jgi:hypothetical protein
MTADIQCGGASDIVPAASWVVRWWWLWATVALVAGGVTVAAADGFPIVDLELA